jgi:mycothiol S-conjugate amidase
MSRLHAMFVHAHPDDESSKGAATMARYAKEGYRVSVVTLTDGSAGDILNPAMDRPEVKENLAAVRQAEMDAAREILGVRQEWLGFMDSGLPEGDPLPPLPWGCFALQPLERAAAPLVRLVRRFRPHVILTYDENGGYPHPDHIQTHNVSVEAFRAAGDPERYPGLGEPWTPQKLYYDRAFNVERFVALHEALEERGLQSPYAARIAMLQESDPEGHRPPAPRHETTTRVRCPDTFALRDEALRSHRTQVAPDGMFFAVSAELQSQVWPWEDYVLAESRVPTDLPEHDLFAGIAG